MAGPYVHLALLIELDGSSSVQSVSNEVPAQLGFTREDFLTSKVTLNHLVHPGDTDIAAHLFSPQIKPPSGDFLIRLRHADGRIRIFRCRFSKELAPSPGCVTVHLQLADVCHIVDPGEAAMISSFKTLISQTNDYIYIKNRNHVYLAASGQMAKFALPLKDSSEFAGKTDYEIFTEQEADVCYALEVRAAAEGKRANLIHEIYDREGKLYWIDNRKYPIGGPNGEIIGIFGVAPDITRHLENERRVLQSEALLHLFVEHAPAALAMFDCNMRYLAVSRRWADDHSMAPREIVGRSHYEVNPEVTEEWKQAHRRGLDGEAQSVEEDRYKRADGTEEWIRWQITPWRADDGSIGGIVMFYEDITERRMSERRVRESEALLHIFVEHAPAALAMFDRNMRYLAANRRWLEMYSLTEAGIIGRCHYDVFPDLPAHWKDAHILALAGHAVSAEEDCFERVDGSHQWLRRELIPWREDDGSVGGIVIFADDVSERVETQERLRLAASVFTHAREGITITDVHGTILDVNESFTRITGYSRDEVVGSNPRVLKSGLQSRGFYEQMWESLRVEGHWSGEIWNRAKSGKIFAEHLTINAICDAGGKVLQYVAHFSDITALKEHEMQLERMTNYDALTDLPNRALLADRLRQAMGQAQRSGQKIAVAYLDIDGLKAVNDRYGRPAGDAILIALAKRFKAALREGDTLARLGGDELVAVMLDLGESDAIESVLKRLLAAAREEMTIEGQRLKVTASIGVTFYPQNEELNEGVLIRQADQAMYQAKLDGRNCFRKFDPSQDLTIRGRHEGREQIRQALAAHEFVLYYQPKVNMRTGEVTGAEALIRWQHPERGLIAPASFLPFIEDHSLAIDVGEWVIETVLAQMETWQSQGLEIPVSVNVGAMQLLQADFVDRLRSLLAAHPRVKPDQIEIEVIETSALSDVLQASKVLNACHKIGVTVALDDFGTGYSSLAYLKRLPANVLKIDQSFVREMFEDPENLTILEGVLGLASAFRLNVIAEGVETTEHGLVLLQLGCEMAQGFGIGRPMPAEEFPNWVAQWRPEPRWTQVKLVSSTNRQMLYAEVELRAWVAAFESYLQGKRIVPPGLDPHQCRFGNWLDTEARALTPLPPALEAINLVHGQIHELANEIFSAHAHDPSSGLSHLPDLHELRDRLLQQIEYYRDGKGTD